VSVESRSVGCTHAIRVNVFVLWQVA